MVVSLNLHRRQLEKSQLAMIGARVKKEFAAEARERQRGGQGGVLLSLNLGKANSFHASDQAAEAVGVSRALVEAASRVLESGTPELIELVDKGEVTVSAASEVSRLPLEEQASVWTAPPNNISGSIFPVSSAIDNDWPPCPQYCKS